MKSQVYQIIALAILVLGLAACSQSGGPSTGPIEASIDFTQTLQDWDGFGVNYVEVAQTMDYENDPQEYCGFSLLTEEERQEILDMIFGEDGDYEVRHQYYYYKQLSRAGQKGMKVATVDIERESDVKLIAFASGSSTHPDAFLVLNKADSPRKINLSVSGSASEYRVFRTTGEEQYVVLPNEALNGGKLSYDAPAGSLTTFFAIK